MEWEIPRDERTGENVEHKNIISALRVPAPTWEFKKITFVLNNCISVVETNFSNSLNVKSLIYKKKRKTDSSPIMLYKYVKRMIAWFCPSCNRYKDLRGQPQRDQGSTLPQCARVRRCKEEPMFTDIKTGTIKQWWNWDSKLWTTGQYKTLPESAKQTHS